MRYQHEMPGYLSIWQRRLTGSGTIRFRLHMAYKLSQGTNLWGELYFVEGLGGNFTGWGIFSAQGSSPVAIQIHGLENASGTLTLYLSQPSRKVCFEPNIEAEIRSFDYTVEFVPDKRTTVLKGDLYHPEFPEVDKQVLVATTKLIPSVGGMVNGQR